MCPKKNSTMGDEARGLASGLEVVPATTHFLPMERPQFVREALLAAVQDVEKQ
jgi:pimeloyl-ACP methyl ester carboxylesterase